MVYQISSLQQGLASEGGWAGAASAWLPRAGSRSAGAGATGPEARGVYGGRWPRYARARPTDAAAETHTFAAAGAGHVTPAYARHRCRYGLTRSRRALATLRPRTPHGRRYGKLTRSRRQTLGHTTPHGN